MISWNDEINKTLAKAGAIVTIKDSGAIAVKDMRYMLRTGRIKLDPGRTDDDIEADIETESI